MLLSFAKLRTIYTFVIIFIETRDTPFNVCPPIDLKVALQGGGQEVDTTLGVPGSFT